MIVLDTHVWLWWIHDPTRLSARARQALEAEEKDGTLLVSSISAWEVAVKTELGKLALPMPIREWYETACSYPAVVVEPLDAIDAVESTRLPGGFHKDPADRIVVAVARNRAVPLVTRDERILAYPHVQTVW